jgi:hypothetical protein
VADDILKLLRDFQHDVGDLDHINKAYLVLLPKEDGATHPKDYRPISLFKIASPRYARKA